MCQAYENRAANVAPACSAILPGIPDPDPDRRPATRDPGPRAPRPPAPRPDPE
jgi:hypothetical protein